MSSDTETCPCCGGFGYHEQASGTPACGGSYDAAEGVYGCARCDDWGVIPAPFIGVIVPAGGAS